METKAVSRYVRIAPRKARIVVDLVRGKSVPQAREILAFCERAAAETVVKTLNSAVANAEHNNHLRGDNLVVEMGLADVERRTVDLMYRVTRTGDGAVVALAKTGMVAFDYAKNRLADLPPAFLEKMGAKAI